DQRTFADFAQQQVQRATGDPQAPTRPVDPVPDVIPAVPREAGDEPDQLLADENNPGGDSRIVERLRPMSVERLPDSWDRDRHPVRFRVQLQVVYPGQIARLNRTEPNTVTRRPVAVVRLLGDEVDVGF